MGRHRRSDAYCAATGSATGIMQADGTAEGHDPLHDAEYGRTMGIAPYLNPEAYAGDLRAERGLPVRDGGPRGG